MHLSLETLILLEAISGELGTERSTSFYQEQVFSESDAYDAGETMNKVYSAIKKSMGGPMFSWEPNLT